MPTNSPVLRKKVNGIIQNLAKETKAAFAVSGIATDKDYCDFFVENGGDGKPWHEKCPEDMIGFDLATTKFSDARVKRIDELKLRKSASDDYCDFFVENGGDGKPWHEKCPDPKDVALLRKNPVARAILVSRTNVMNTFNRAMNF